MLSVESLSSIQIGSEREKVEDEGSSFSIGVDDFAIGSLLEDINFDDLFAGIEDGDQLPELDLDAEMLVQLSSHVEDSNQLNASPCASDGDSCKEKERRKVGENLNLQGDESTVLVAASSDGESGRKPASSSNASRAKVPLGKRKAKVDWTPELHRRFVQAVEQLGVDKAVPSRILELMAVDCLTRHNIASHLQKYRSHRKHLLAREAEATNRSERRQQLYSGGRREAFAGKREMAVPWAAPTIPFPPPAGLIQHTRPLHVWGHPHRTVDQATPHVWPKHLVRPSSPSPPPAWMPAPSLYSDPTRPYWFPHRHVVVNHLTRGSPCYPMQPSSPTGFSRAPPVPGIPQKTYKQDHSLPIPTNQSNFWLQIDFHIPSKESIDAAVEDVLAKPWLPLPLGLKSPSTESVLVELQRGGYYPNLPP